MTERLSTILVAAIAALGIQKVGYELSSAFLFRVMGWALIGVGLFGLLGLLWARWSGANQGLHQLQRWCLKATVFLLLFRVSLPGVAWINEGLYHHYFGPKIRETQQTLSVFSSEVRESTEVALPQRGQKGGLLAIKRTVQAMVHWFWRFWDRLQSIRAHAGDLIQAMVRLTYLYIAMVVFEAVVLPLVWLWLLIQMTRRWFGPPVSLWGGPSPFGPSFQSEAFRPSPGPGPQQAGSAGERAQAEG